MIIEFTKQLSTKGITRRDRLGSYSNYTTGMAEARCRHHAQKNSQAIQSELDCQAASIPERRKRYRPQPPQLSCRA
jgi:hypothetical protein